jgi:[ribosomal protein S5]-alanine N-acetyltransferase
MNAPGPNKTPPILETARMVFRPFTPGDFDLLAELHRDPEVGRYMGGVWDEAEIARSLARFVAEHAERGHSKWCVHTKEGVFVGRAGVSVWPATGELELGYAFRPEFWGQGLATEAARAVAEWTFANIDVGYLIAFTDPENYGSQRVLERIGMTRLEDRDMGFDRPSAYFRMERP